MDRCVVPPPSPAATAQTLARVLRALWGMGFSCGLNPAQWAALRYIAGAAPGPCSVIAFARHHGTTKGTASQTVTALEKKGLITRVRDEGDRRSVRLRPTAVGLALLEHDPLNALTAAIGLLPPEQQNELAAAASEVLTHLHARRAASTPAEISGGTPAPDR